MEVIQMVGYEGKHLEIPSGIHPNLKQILEESNLLLLS